MESMLKSCLQFAEIGLLNFVGSYIVNKVGAFLSIVYLIQRTSKLTSILDKQTQYLYAMLYDMHQCFNIFSYKSN